VLVQGLDPPQGLLGDFGCASHEEVMHYDSPGTIPYLAPEQEEGKTHTRSVDLWSCAIVGSQLLGAPLNMGRLLPGKKLQALQESLENATVAMAACVRNMLEIDPEKRATAAEAYIDLTNSLKYAQAASEQDDDTGKRSLNS